MFANETHMQARLLDMRGLHDWAGKFVEPFVALQGSKPFPGRFKDGSAIYHGVRVDKAHDYTHSGYNLNHGWTLWTLSEHFLFTRDEQWLKQKLPSMKRARTGSSRNERPPPSSRKTARKCGSTACCQPGNWKITKSGSTGTQ